MDESYVIVQDGPRGRQFCVLVDRVADQDLPLLPYPDLGSTERAMIRPAPDGDGLVAYLATDAALPRRQLVALPLGPGGLARRTPASSARGRMPSSKGWTATTRASLLLLVWNVAGGGSELELLDTRTGTSRKAPEPPGVVSGALLSRDGSTAVMSVEGPLRPRELWRSGHRHAGLDPGDRAGRSLPEVGLVRPTWSSSSAGTGCR